MKILKNIDLEKYNTLAVPSVAEYFFEAESVESVEAALRWATEKKACVHILAGGSNVILPERIHGLVLKPCILGRDIVEKTFESVLVRLGAGEQWHPSVVWSLQSGFFGLECLALIPGTVGAAPVQNIGAYGVEVSQFIESVEYIDRQTGKRCLMRAEQCEFAYRESIFKKALKNKTVITHVTFRLPARSRLEYSSLYPALKQVLGGQAGLSSQVIFDAVCAIRQSKLPDPNLIPNCGSFFKNPVVAWEQYQLLLKLNPTMPSYSVKTDSGEHAQRKLAAAWLIDQAGWKGKCKYGVTIHDQQALVFTNPEHLPAIQVLKLAAAVEQSVMSMFGVTLEMEPQVLG